MLSEMEARLITWNSVVTLFKRVISPRHLGTKEGGSMTPTAGAPHESPSLQPSRAPNVVEMESLRQVEILMTALENRWAGYWQEMQSLLSTRLPHGHACGGAAMRMKRKRIRSAVYGDVDLQYPDLMLLVDMPYVQRLRQTSQMGLVHFVYPEARHSRFDHTLGVAWNVQQICSSLGRKVSPKEKRTLLAAAILHDIGHGPFSHCTEMWEESLSDNVGGVWGWSGDREGMPAYHEFPENDITIVRDKVKPHEVNGVRLIYDHPIALALVRKGLARIGTSEQQSAFARTPSLGIRRLLRLLKVDPVAVSQMIVGDRNHGGALVDIINGELDADKFDYYQRDAYFTGAGKAGADVEYIIHNMELVPLPRRMGGHKAFAWPLKVVNDLVFNLMSRKYFYINTANHPVAQNANAMLATAFFESYRALQDACLCLDSKHANRHTAGKFLAYLPFMEDQDVWAFLDTMARAKSNDRYRQDCCRVTNCIVRKLRARSLFTRSLPLTGAACNQFTQKIYSRLNKVYNRRSVDKNQLVDFVYLIHHPDHIGQIGNREPSALEGITLIDWGWNPDNQKTLEELTNQKKRLFGYEKTGMRPSICIKASKCPKELVTLSQALDDSSNDAIATGIAKYEYSMSFVQVLNSDVGARTSANREEISEKTLDALLKQVAVEYDAVVKIQSDITAGRSSVSGCNLHNADMCRIGPDPARPDMVIKAIEDILSSTGNNDATLPAATSTP